MTQEIIITQDFLQISSMPTTLKALALVPSIEHLDTSCRPPKSRQKVVGSQFSALDAAAQTKQQAGYSGS